MHSQKYKSILAEPCLLRYMSEASVVSTINTGVVCTLDRNCRCELSNHFPVSRCPNCESIPILLPSQMPFSLLKVHLALNRRRESTTRIELFQSPTFGSNSFP